jgi:phospholipase/carboxylesterase
LPVRTFLPTGYEPNYPYPLLVFFHGHQSSEEQILSLAPRVSRRNFVCMALRGPQSLGIRADGRVGYSWGPESQCDAAVEDYVFHAVEEARRNYHIHSERIYLAGYSEGATMAYRLGIQYPDKFAGVIALNGGMPRGGPLFRFPAIRQLRVLICHGIANAMVPLASAKRDFRVLYSAGLAVRMHTYPATHRIHPDMLRDVNRWVIDMVTRESR